MAVDSAKRPLLTLLMATILVANLFFVFPFTIYMGNAEEFTIPFLDLIVWYAIPACVLLLLLILPSLFLRARYHRAYTVALAVLGLLLWIQGGLVVWDYGVLDGREIDWQGLVWRGWVDTAIWVAVIAMVVVFYRKISGLLIRFAVMVFLLQLLMLLVQGVGNIERLEKQPRSADVETLRELGRFSTHGNVLHLLLDGFPADSFEKLVFNPADVFGYRKRFDGFTFFSETLSVFPFTRFAVPAFLSGVIYQNHMPKNDFIRKALSEESIINTAFDHGFEVDLASVDYWVPMLKSGHYTNAYVIPFDTHASSDELSMNAATHLLDMSLFRVLPHWLKRTVYNDQKWLLGSTLGNSEYLGLLYFAHTAFLNHLIDDMTVDRDAPVYKFIHVMNTHNPMVVNEQCQYAGELLPTSRVNLGVQSRCTLEVVLRLFDRMKALGIYDDTLIVMHGDHGGWAPLPKYNPPDTPEHVPVRDWAVSLGSPLLAIKPAGASGEIRASSELASLLDLPETIASLMGWQADFPGQALFAAKPDPHRQRSYYLYSWQKDAWTVDYAGPITEFLISGSHYRSAWRKGRVFQPPPD